jgi:broad specificity phosphatase PhoE
MSPNNERPCRVVLVRHATAEGQGRFLGQQDASLSARGRRELPRLMAKLAMYDIEGVYCSDLRRARSTARAIASAAQLAIAVRPGLREMHFGRWEGRSWREIARTNPSAARSWLKHFPKHRAPGGEAFGIPDGHLFRLAQEPCAINVVDYFGDGAVVHCVNG